MKSKILALITLFTLGCDDSQQDTARVVEEETINTWSTLTTPEGFDLRPPPEITWEIDKASCGDLTESYRLGFRSAAQFWSQTAGTTISESTGGPPTLHVTCTEFVKKLGVNRRAWFLRAVEFDRHAQIKHMIVEIPNNYPVCDNTPAGCKKFVIFSLSKVGVGLNVLGLVHGVQNELAGGRKPELANIEGLLSIK